jgi:hypothetical protein
MYSTSIASATASALLGLSATSSIGDARAISIGEEHFTLTEYTHKYTEVRRAAVKLLEIVGDVSSLQLLRRYLDMSIISLRNNNGGKTPMTGKNDVDQELKKAVQEALRQIERRVGAK